MESENISFEDYIKKQLEKGFIDSYGTPLKCECGCKKFKKVNIYNE